MKGSYLGLGIFGILLILFGAVFALQGSGKIGGSAMTGNPFWIYAGTGIAVIGIILASLGFYMGSRRTTSRAVTEEEKGKVVTGASPSDSVAQDKETH